MVCFNKKKSDTVTKEKRPRTKILASVYFCMFYSSKLHFKWSLITLKLDSSDEILSQSNKTSLWDRSAITHDQLVRMHDVASGRWCHESVFLVLYPLAHHPVGAAFLPGVPTFTWAAALIVECTFPRGQCGKTNHEVRDRNQTPLAWSRVERLRRFGHGGHSMNDPIWRHPLALDEIRTLMIMWSTVGKSLTLVTKTYPRLRRFNRWLLCFNEWSGTVFY